VQSTNDVFTPAFQLLAKTVNDFHLRGRPCLGATLKPRLYGYSFNEKSIGFRKFGDFLRAAEAAGYVRLGKTAGGDIAISPASVASAQATPPLFPPAAVVPPAFGNRVLGSSPVSHTIPTRIRQDLWNAFNSLSDRWVYDPDRDVAFKDNKTAWEGPALPGTNTVPVPAGSERVAEWMRSFADLQEPEMKAWFTGAIDRGVEIYQFNTLTRSQGLQRAWSRFHIQKVLAAIESWATANNLHPKNLSSPSFNPTVIPVPAEVRVPVSSPAVTEVTPAPRVSAPLNSRLESLIDALINELISLRGLLQVVGPKQS
jgi:hypothetical protein